MVLLYVYFQAYSALFHFSKRDNHNHFLCKQQLRGQRTKENKEEQDETWSEG